MEERKGMWKENGKDDQKLDSARKKMKEKTRRHLSKVSWNKLSCLVERFLR